MWRNLLYSGLVFMFLAFTTWSGTAQRYKYVVKLPEIPVTGFYQVDLLPEVVAKLQPDLQDLRIIDLKGAQVPYILQTSDQQVSRDSDENPLLRFPILYKRLEADKQTHIVAENVLRAPINHLILTIKNTEASRKISISGSDDLKQWFVIQENINLNNLYASDADSVLHEIAFPNSHYRYFKIIVLGKELLPFNVTGTSVRIYRRKADVDYVILPDPVASQTDSSDGFSYIRLQFREQYSIDKLTLQIAGTKFFKRTISISSGKNNRDDNRYILSSTSPATYSLNLKTNQLLLRIENGDNPPLKVIDYKAYQSPKAVIAWLEKTKSYKMVFGDSLAIAPTYDLAYFKDSIQPGVTVIRHSEIESNTNEQAHSLPVKQESSAFMWVVIGSVLALLPFFSCLLLK